MFPEGLTLNRDWIGVDELIGSATRRLIHAGAERERQPCRERQDETTHLFSEVLIAPPRRRPARSPV